MLRRDKRFGNFTHSQCHALVELGQRDRLAVGDLAEVLLQDKSTTTRFVRPLVDRKLVKVRGNPRDQRSKLLTLTRGGRQSLDRVNREANRQVRSALSVLSDGQRQTVVEGMALYAKALERARRLDQYHVRPIRKTDDPAMARIIRDVMTEYGAVGEGYSIEDPEVNAMYAAYHDNRSAFFVAEDANGEVIGGAGIGPLNDGPQGVCELRKMYLLPRARGTGVGRRLLELCLAAARERGYRQCYLETLNSMTEARRLYEKFGFRPLEGPKGNTGHTGCNMWSILEL